MAMAATVNELSVGNRHVTEREIERERGTMECQELQIWIADWLKLFYYYYSANS